MSNHNVVRISEIRLDCRNLDTLAGFSKSFYTADDACKWMNARISKGELGDPKDTGQNHETELTVAFDNGGAITFEPFSSDYGAMSLENSISVAISRMRKPDLGDGAMYIDNYVKCLSAYMDGRGGWLGEDDISDVSDHYGYDDKIAEAAALRLKQNSAPT